MYEQLGRGAFERDSQHHDVAGGGEGEEVVDVLSKNSELREGERDGQNYLRLTKFKRCLYAPIVTKLYCTQYILDFRS